uniref:Toxin candidate TRINITY_DN19888_c0_g3_i2 n=1 Tax=Ceriantheomorphe brasiliensis TaxID=1048506 RepID=A0A7G7WYZ7_9CNID|nr:toxin candidate TRINITY_DN19888_c0_g3_i2 [Ceriantheomorphe brasiliensis]
MMLRLVLTGCLLLQVLETTGQDLLTSEGEEGWLEKVLGSRVNDPATEDHINISKRALEEAPVTLINNFVRGLDEELDTEKAKLVKDAVNDVKTGWKDKSYNERHAMVSCIQSASRNMKVFFNTKDDPVSSIQAGMEIVASFAMLFGPHGQAAAAGLSFISAFLSLFGKGKNKPEPMEKIVKRQVDQALEEFYERTLSDEVSGTLTDFQLSKSFLDGVRSETKTLSDTEANALASHVPVYKGVKFMGILAGQIEDIKKDNPYGGSKVKKCLKYIELYSQLATLKTEILIEMAALLPDSHKNIRNGIHNVITSLYKSQKEMMKFLYESDYTNYILPFYMPFIYTSTDKYATSVLKIPNYNRDLSGIWCLKYYGVSDGYLTWQRQYEKLLVGGYPYTSFTSYKNCFWRLVPHGKNLYSIVNNYHCPGYDYCYSLLYWQTIKDGVFRVYMHSSKAVMWEIQKRGNYYRIRSKYGCKSGDWRCNRELGRQQEPGKPIGIMRGGRKIYENVPTGGLLSGVGYYWQITK